ncbi:MAG TPA: gamma-glutamyltransferase [Acidobacteriota bacterium]|nr:gamma-glutamyltransferase [Acidobacteriota bacterium]
MMRSARCLGVLFLVILGVVPGAAASKAPVRGAHAMVVSTEPHATEVGVDILQTGGNAIDAAVAVGFALAVTHPAAGNLGGGGFMMIRLAKTGEFVAVDYREKAPGAASRTMYQDEKGEIIRDSSTIGYRASGVPGTVAGLALALQKYGTMNLAQVMAPAIALASNGIRLSFYESESLRHSSNLLGRFPETRRIFLRENDPYSEGDLFAQPDLANSLEQISRNGAREFYEGSIAQLIARDMAENHGLITLEDLSKYRPTLRTPLEGTYRDYRIVSMPSPSSGGTVLLEMLNILEGFPLAKYGPGSSRTLHLEAETMKRSFADRAEFLGDGDFVKLPTSGLISKRYADQIRGTIDPYLAADAAKIGHGDPGEYESGQTTHFSIVDKDGNAVANTYTLNGGYGSGVTIPGTGILMNNEMDDFSSKPGVANAYGLIQGEANAIAPGKRPLSAMTPTFVLRGDKLFMVLGSPGGPTIINTVLQTVINVIDFGMTIQEAVDAPRIHHQWMPDRLVLEGSGFAEDVVQALRARGHNVVVDGTIGDCQAILIDPRTGVRLGAADPRLDGRALGY